MQILSLMARRMGGKPPWCGGGLAALLLMTAATAAPAPAAEMDVQRKKPGNLVSVDEPAVFDAEITNIGSGSGEVTVEATDYFGETTTLTVPVESSDGGKIEFTIDLGSLEPGYYELTASLDYEEHSGETASAEYTRRIRQFRGTNEERFHDTEPFSFGVAHFVNRTAEEAREQGSRFGLKIWKLGEPGVWWRADTVYDVAELTEAFVNLGLQWTRHDFVTQPNHDEPGIIGTHELIENHDVNVIHKVEGIPEEAYDEQRYGPMDEYREKYGKNWRRTSVPKKEPYQVWLQEQIAELPAEQDVFEIGNEVWNYMSMEDFAEWCQMAVEAILEVRPNAIVGPDPGPMRHARRFVAAGGLDGSNMVVIHPYTFSPLPEGRIRPWLRNYKAYLEKHAGRELDIYITEYGFSTAPENKRSGRSVSERVQAQRTVRQSLMLYAEGCRTLIPHTMASRDYDVTDEEHWWGFFRLSGQPKPVLMAHAANARMIDGSTFVGDLWYGPGVGAMLFERDGEYTVALWTRDEAPGAGRSVSINVDADEITQADIMGRERTVSTNDGVVDLSISGNVTYLVGVGEGVVDHAITPEQDMRTDRWIERAGSFSAAHAPTPPTMDGELDEWSRNNAVRLLSDDSAEAASGRRARFAWGADHLYVALESPSQDAEVIRAVRLWISTQPAHQIQRLKQWEIYDYAFEFQPAADGPGRVEVSNVTWEEPRVFTDADDASGVRWSSDADGDGWTAEIAIPRELLDGFPDEPAGHRMSCFVELVESDAGSENDRTRFANATIPADETLQWPYLELEE